MNILLRSSPGPVLKLPPLTRRGTLAPKVCCLSVFVKPQERAQEHSVLIVTEGVRRQLMVMKTGSFHIKVLLRVGPVQWHGPKDFPLSYQGFLYRMRTGRPSYAMCCKERNLDTVLLNEQCFKQERKIGPRTKIGSRRKKKKRPLGQRT